MSHHLLRGDGRECHEAGEAPGIAQFQPNADPKNNMDTKNDGLEISHLLYTYDL